MDKSKMNESGGCGQQHSQQQDSQTELKHVSEKRTDKNEQNCIWKHLASGAMGGVVSRTVTAPLDRLKVFLQVNGTGQGGSFAVVMRSMYHEGGIKSFWRGNCMNVLKVAPNSALTFMTYDLFKQMLQGDDRSELTASKRFVAGGLAGAISSTFIFPLDTLKTRLALRTTGQYRGIIDATASIYRKEGARVFYRGLLPNVLGILPYAGIELAMYETLKNGWLRRYPTQDEPSTLLLLACGSAASTAGQLVSYPLALIRTRMQAPASLNAPTSMTGISRCIWRSQGVRGFYSGILPNFLKAVPSVAISYIVYEKCRQQLGATMT